MLSDRSRPVIEATLPVVAENIEEIATRFYTHLFEEHPELLDGTFNRGNQAEKTQQMALAASVAVFASSLVKVPEQLPEHLLNRIAHKHASLGITPAQYDVVHDVLFWAGVMPSDACLCAIRLSRCSGSCSGTFTSELANTATDAARAICWVFSAWLPRLNVPSSSSGCSPNRCW